METLWMDIRYAVRGLRRAPGFALAAVATLALGIGANTAIFAGVEAALLRSLPFGAPDRIVHLWESTRDNARRQLSYPDYLDLREQARSFESVAGYGFFGATLRGGEGLERLAGARVSANFFDTLGVAPALGRSFRPDEDLPGRARDVVVLSDGAWRRRFGADPGIVGRALTLSGAPYTVIGVLPRSFEFARLGDPELFVTLSPSVELAGRRYTHWMWSVARLAPGATLAGARTELETLARRRAGEDPRWHAATGLAAMPIREAFVGEIEPLLFGLLAGVGAVLLIACANVASMTLARAAGREREIGVRLALGVGRARLVRQFLTESLVLTLIGGAAGLAGALWGVRAIAAAVPAERARFLPFLDDLALRPGVLAFTFTVCLAASALIGIAPALRISRRPGMLVREGARGATDRREGRHRLVVAEIALALVLVSAAGLVGRSLSRLLDADAGFRRDHLLTATIALPGDRYPTPAAQLEAFRRIEEALAALPGAIGAAFVDQLPLQGDGNSGHPTVVGRAAAGEGGVDAEMRTVSAGYFEVVGVPLLAGRGFAATDRPDAPRVVLVNRRLAAELLPGEEAVGRRISFAFMDDVPLEIVGVVGDEAVSELGARPAPAVYFPQSQDVSPVMSVMVRTTVTPESLLRLLPSTVRALEPGALVADVATLEALVDESAPVFLRRYPLLLLGSFAALALVLAAVGVYGVMALFVGQRTRELGIRLALGAAPRDVRALVLGQGVRVALLGVLIGSAGAWGAGRALTGLLYETPAADPLVFVAAAAALVATALLACALPARRATKIDPQVALRGD